jgi:hypothetical protein
MSTSPKKNAKAKLEKLSLLDEVNELIEKERTLLNLKVIEQKNEAEEWKTKYDALVEKVASNASENAEVELLMAVAETSAETPQTTNNPHDINQIIMTRKHSWTLELDSVSLDLSSFAHICKTVFGPHSSFKDIRVLSLKGCAINDEFINSALSLFRSASLSAIDLSLNSFGEAVLNGIVETLKV